MKHNSVGRLIELLSEYPKDMEITNEENCYFIHIVNRQDDKITLSTKQPIGHCQICGDYVYKTIVRGYEGVCPSCDANLFSFEITPLEKRRM